MAATAIGRRIGLPRRIVTILEGESLLNDATALVALGTALAVAEGSGFEPVDVGLDFLLAAGGGVAVGFVFFLVVAKLRRHLTDPVLDSGISLVVPFAAYVAAEEVHASGVIAVVVAGLLLGHKAPILQTAQSRIAERLNWRTIAFVLENTVFLLIGLQARSIVEGAGEGDLSWGRIIGLCAATLAACVVLRLLWVFPARYLIVRPGPDPVTGRRPPWTYTFMLGWAGMRGVVTLAAAFVIPEDTPHREVLLLMAFTVVAGTLFIQGMSLPWLARRLRVPGPDPAEDALARATLLQQASKAALHRLEELEYDDSQGVVELIRQRLDQRNFAAWERLSTELGPGVAQRPLRPGPAGDARGRAGAGAGDPQRRHRRLGGGRRRTGPARRRGVDARHRDRGAAQRARDRVGPASPAAAAPTSSATRRSRPPRTRSASAASTRGYQWVSLRQCLECGNVGCCDSSVDAARHQALPRDHPPGHGVRRARRGLALVLRAPQDRLSRASVTRRKPTALEPDRERQRAGVPETGSQVPGPSGCRVRHPLRQQGQRDRHVGAGDEVPRQWWMPAPKPWCGGRCWVMSNDGSGTARGSVPAACDSICTMPPFGMCRPWNSTSSSASRVTQVTVGLTRITSSTALPPSSGRSPSSRHWSGWASSVCRARPELVAGGLHPGEREEDQRDRQLAVAQLLRPAPAW